MKSINDNDPLLRLLVEFFDLPDDTQPENIRQPLLASWDSLAMVQLITELEGTFLVKFDIEEIQRLRSYDEIRAALVRKVPSAPRGFRESHLPRSSQDDGISPEASPPILGKRRGRTRSLTSKKSKHV
jgi:acyl carrier protein